MLEKDSLLLSQELFDAIISNDFRVPLLRNHNLNIVYGRNNKINVLP
jgi:hypothetical protein